MLEPIPFAAIALGSTPPAGASKSWDAPRPDAFSSAIARSGRQGTRASAARYALALGAREHGGTQPT